MESTPDAQTACTGNAAWAHWSSESLVFVMHEMHWRRIPSMDINVGCPEQGEERRIWRIFGVLIQDFNRTRASWAAIYLL